MYLNLRVSASSVPDHNMQDPYKASLMSRRATLHACSGCLCAHCRYAIRGVTRQILSGLRSLLIGHRNRHGPLKSGVPTERWSKADIRCPPLCLQCMGSKDSILLTYRTFGLQTHFPRSSWRFFNTERWAFLNWKAIAVQPARHHWS